MNCLIYFSKLKLPTIIGFIGLCILIGCLTPSLEGLTCYDCMHLEDDAKSTEACLQPVSENATNTTNCTGPTDVCVKRTKLSFSPRTTILVQLNRGCEPAPAKGGLECKNDMDLTIDRPEFVDGKPAWDFTLPDAIKNWTIMDGFSYTATCYCDSDNCNKDPGIFYDGKFKIKA